MKKMIACKPLTQETPASVVFSFKNQPVIAHGELLPHFFEVHGMVVFFKYFTKPSLDPETTFDSISLHDMYVPHTMLLLPECYSDKCKSDLIENTQCFCYFFS